MTTTYITDAKGNKVNEVNIVNGKPVITPYVAPKTTTTPTTTTKTTTPTTTSNVVNYDAKTGAKLAPGATTTDALGNTFKQGTQFVLPKTTAPTTATAITPMPDIKTPVVSPYTGDITGATAATAGVTSNIDTQSKIIADRQAQVQAEIDAQTKANKPLLDKLLGSKSPDQARIDAQAATGINPADYFAEQKSKIAEIDSLTSNYNKVLAARDAQLAATSDKYASNSFINNQQAQINRNAAPELNRLSADINSKTAVLKALEGNFNEARDFVNQAVQDATATTKFNYDLYTEFAKINADNIDQLDAPYKAAFDAAIAESKTQYNNQVDEKKQVGQLMIDNPKAGITINDSLDSAYTKVSNSGGSLAYQKSLTTGSTGTAAERAANAISQFQSAFVAGSVINGTPVIDQNGYVTPVAWKAAIADAPAEGLDRNEFIKAFGYLLYQDKSVPASSYGLTPQEIKLING